jgi:hypothetical protein
MQGTLDTFSVVEILQMLGKAKRSGTLHIECPHRLIDVHFAQGGIAETRDSTRVATDSVIGSLLLKRALVNEGQLTQALAEQERLPRPLGTQLVEMGFVGEAELREVLSRQIANTLVAAKVETSGTFMFVADPSPKRVDYITVDTHPVLVDISSLGGDYCLAVEVLGQANTVLVRNGDYETLPRNPMAMGRDEFMVLAQVDGQRTVREVTAASRLDEVTVISILGKLAESGVVLVKAGHQTRAEDDEELRAHRDSVWAEVSSLLDDLTGGEDEMAPAAAASAGAADALAPPPAEAPRDAAPVDPPSGASGERAGASADEEVDRAWEKLAPE